MPGQHVGPVEHGDARLVQVPAHRVPGERAGPLEAGFVVGLGVRDVDLPAHRVGDHVEEHGADVGEARGLRRRAGVGVDREDVEVGQREAHPAVPVAAELVLPVVRRVVEADDEADLGLRRALDVGVRGGKPARHGRAAHGARPGRRAAVTHDAARRARWSGCRSGRRRRRPCRRRGSRRARAACRRRA